ncbi:MAG: hypothetical protein RIC55_05150 [Pirellulaceae bacterium]
MSTTQTIDRLLEDVFAQAKSLMRRRYLEIRQLAGSNLPPGKFFDAALQATVDIYAASAGAVWMREEPQGRLRCVAQTGIEKLGLTGEYEQPHEALVRYAAAQPKPFLVRPNSSPRVGAGVSNPTDSFLVFGPLVHNGAMVGVIELFLGPRPVRGKTPEVRTGYARFMEHLTPWIVQYLLRQLQAAQAKKCDDAKKSNDAKKSDAAAAQPLRGSQFTGSQFAGSQFALRMVVAAREVAAHREAIRRTLERVVQEMTGLRAESLQQGRDVASGIHQLLDANGMRVACPQCGAASILRCQAGGGGALFVFDHTLAEGRTFHGGVAELPRLRVVAKSRRRGGVPRTPK